MFSWHFISTHKFYVQEISSENGTICDTMWKNDKGREVTDDYTIWPMRIACWIAKIIDTPRICNTVINAFPRR